MGKKATVHVPINTPPDAASVLGLNQAVVRGTLVSAPESRRLGSGTLAVSFSLTVRSPGAKTTSVPVVWYDPPKRIGRWKSGDDVVVCGEVVRRFFRGAGGLGSSTEIVVASAELSRHETKAARLRQKAAEALAS